MRKTGGQKQNSKNAGSYFQSKAAAIKLKRAFSKPETPSLGLSGQMGNAGKYFQNESAEIARRENVKMKTRFDTLDFSGHGGTALNLTAVDSLASVQALPKSFNVDFSKVPNPAITVSAGLPMEAFGKLAHSTADIFTRLGSALSTPEEKSLPQRPHKVYLIKGGNEETREEKAYKLTQQDSFAMYGVYHNKDKSEYAVVFANEHGTFRFMNFDLAKEFSGQEQLPDNFSTSALGCEPRFGVITVGDTPKFVFESTNEMPSFDQSVSADKILWKPDADNSAQATINTGYTPLLRFRDDNSQTISLEFHNGPHDDGHVQARFWSVDSKKVVEKAQELGLSVEDEPNCAVYKTGSYPYTDATADPGKFKLFLEAINRVTPVPVNDGSRKLILKTFDENLRKQICFFAPQEWESEGVTHRIRAGTDEELSDYDFTRRNKLYVCDDKPLSDVQRLHRYGHEYRAALIYLAENKKNMSMEEAVQEIKDLTISQVREIINGKTRDEILKQESVFKPITHTVAPDDDKSMENMRFREMIRQDYEQIGRDLERMKGNGGRHLPRASYTHQQDLDDYDPGMVAPRPW